MTFWVPCANSKSSPNHYTCQKREAFNKYKVLSTRDFKVKKIRTLPRDCSPRVLCTGKLFLCEFVMAHASGGYCYCDRARAYHVRQFGNANLSISFAHWRETVDWTLLNCICLCPLFFFLSLFARIYLFISPRNRTRSCLFWRVVQVMEDLSSLLIINPSTCCLSEGVLG